MAEYEDQLAAVAMATSKTFAAGEGKKMKQLKKRGVRLEQELTLLRKEPSARQEQKNIAKMEFTDVKRNPEKL